MRGGSSKGVYFLASDLPRDTAHRDRVLLAAMGSPDARQIDGLGGGDDQTSKVMLVGRSAQEGIDVEYRFAQVSVVRDLVDMTPNSGNMLAGVAPFAIERGLVAAGATHTVVRILDLNTGKVVTAEVQTPGGRVAYQGNFKLDSVPGTGSPIRLRFMDPAGGRTGRLLPTGRSQDVVDGIPLTCVDFANPIVMLEAATVGKSGHESKRELDADHGWLLGASATPCAEALAPDRHAGGRRAGAAAHGSWAECEPRMDPVPALGEHTDAILGRLGYSAERIASLRAAQAI